jgi:hypothetical protein
MTNAIMLAAMNYWPSWPKPVSAPLEQDGPEVTGATTRVTSNPPLPNLAHMTTHAAAVIPSSPQPCPSHGVDPTECGPRSEDPPR